MKKAAFYTLGCKVNQYETEALTGIFEREGYEIVDFDTKADVYVINTCTVTGMSARKSRQMIRRAKTHNSDSIVVVTGCYSQTEPGEVLAIPEVNLVIGTRDRDRIMEYIHEIETGSGKINGVQDIMKVRKFEKLNVNEYKDRTRAFLKIQDGCSQYCSYCIIPYARGPIRSREPEEVLDEVGRLSQKGFKEVVLTGIHVASYGKDLKTTSLIDLIEKIHRIEGIERIRLGSVEPTLITPEFVKTAAGLSKLCPHYHISLQSGCDETLRRMNRKYDTSGFRRVVELLRQNIGDVALTTDVMVGFPGETDQEFERTFEFLKEVSFAQMHVFKYSPRKGTPAAGFSEQVAPEVKDKRSDMLLELARENTLCFNRSFIGRALPVLFEQEVKDMAGFVEGLTPNYIRTLVKNDGSLTGTIKKVVIESALEDYAAGSLV